MNQEPNVDESAVDMARHRTALAGFRTRLALDRTMLAWIRTSLSMTGFGFGMVGFFRALRERSQTAENVHLHEGAIRMGTAFVILGIIATVFAGCSQWFALRRLRRGEAPVLTHWSLSITVAVLLAIIGIAGLWALFA
ncbi:MAG TPA: DUF202 domain-containing protein [Planctomycetaceae bacterium]|jgi:putative membrane protein|nr:DUF202 domain-containing protein [Planctomycetaceae bacterium]